jgi:NAD(P)-dependent dehydrogenase (short-subunit alcohol dehydrogenase family)
MQIAGQHFFITGGGSGLGAACARRFVAHGGAVTIADRNLPHAQLLAAELGSVALSVECDVCSTESLQAALQQGCERLGPVRGAICCAGILAASRVVSSQVMHDLELFRRVIEVNLIGTFNTVRIVANTMLTNDPNDAGERGVLVLTSSIAAEEGQIGQAAYAASKGGIASLVLPLAREFGRFGIRVMAIAPGVFDTPLMTAAPAAVRSSLEQQIPFPARFGQPAEFAQLVQQILENSYLNGTTLRLDGGIRMAAK